MTNDRVRMKATVFACSLPQFIRMYNNLQLAARYLRFYLAASNGKGHGMHSPFVFDFIVNVLNAEDKEPQPDIEALRRRLQGDQSQIEVEDLGAGSRKHANTRTIRDLALHSLKPPKLARLLYRAALHYRPASILELGTSLGLTTAYF